MIFTERKQEEGEPFPSGQGFSFLSKYLYIKEEVLVLLKYFFGDLLGLLLKLLKHPRIFDIITVLLDKTAHDAFKLIKFVSCIRY